MSDVSGQLHAALTGRYAVDAEIGKGGMAVVLRARDLRHERWVALKVLRPDISSSLAAERFLREIRLAAGLQHPHIVPVHDSGEAGGFLFYVMPYVEGESLRARLDREGALPLDEAMRITREVADALQYAHERDIVHRDIKPENVLLSGGHALVADFGIARAISAAGGLKLTETGLAVGTPAYMSPEQVNAEARIDARADVYALGCVLFEMVTGQQPYQGSSAQVIMAQHTTADAPSARRMRPALPESVDAAIRKALAKTPADRFGSAAEFAALLPLSTDTHETTRRWRVTRGSAAVLTAVATALVTAGGWLAQRAKASQPELISIAVAPIQNLGDSSDAYFADGITQELSSALTRIRGIAPRPYATVAALAATEKDPIALGRRLRVEYVLSSTLRRSRNQIRLATELIRVRDGINAWSPESYNGSDSDLFVMQDSIVTKIVRQLARGFVPQVTTVASTGRGRGDPEAYQLYLRGRQQRLVSADGSRRAVEFFSRAIERDSTFADAWAALAAALGNWAQYSGESPSTLTHRRVDAINRALSLDSLNGEAWLERAMLTQQTEWDNQKSKQQIERALELAPALAWAHNHYSGVLERIYGLDSALAAISRATQLDPTNAHFPMIRGFYLQAYGRLEEAEAAVRKALALDPDSWTSYTMLSFIAQKRGRHDEAVRFAERAHLLQGGGDPFSLSYLGLAYGRAGRPSDAAKVVERLTEMSRRRYVQRGWLAVARVGAGDRAGALADIEASANLREGDFGLALVTVATDLWLEPAFQELVRRTGFGWTSPPRI